MVSGELVEYLYEVGDAGLKPETVKKAVLAQGWTPQDFDAAVQFIKDHERQDSKVWWKEHWPAVALVAVYVLIALGLLLK